MPRPEKHVFICAQSRPPGATRATCGSSGGSELGQRFAAELEQRGLLGRIALTMTGCLDACDQGPTVLVYPDGVLYGPVAGAEVVSIIEEHLLGGEPVARLRVPPEIWS